MKCAVPGCTNEREQGDFVGLVCAPCYEYFTTRKGEHSQAYKNDEIIRVIKEEIVQKLFELYSDSEPSFEVSGMSLQTLRSEILKLIQLIKGYEMRNGNIIKYFSRRTDL